MSFDCTESSEDAIAYQRVVDALQNDEPVEVTVLCAAIRRDDEHTVRTCCTELKAGMSLIPKAEAIRTGMTHLLKILLDADDAIDEDLMASACQRKDRKSIRMLLDYGWSINRPLYLDALPLWMSVDDMEFMHWLIENGADVHARSDFDQSTLSTAIVQGSMEIVRFLLKQEKDVTRGNLLHCAAERDNQLEGADLVEELAKKGVDVNAHRHNNAIAIRQRYLSNLPTPLHVACYRSNLPVARALLFYGADPNRKMLAANKEIQPTSLEIALQSEDAEMIKLLTRS